MIVFAGSRLKATDSDGNTQSISVIGTESDTLKVGDMETSEYLRHVLKELKIMNLHLQSITDIPIEISDVEV